MAQADWLNREAPLNQALIGQLYAGFLERYRDQISQDHRVVCDRLVESFDGYRSLASGVAHGLVHGDYRLDNMLFGQPGADRPLTVVDWQTVVWGPAMTDVAYFLGGALPERLRRDHYDALLRAYHETLGPEAPISLDDVREGVRRQSFFGVMMAIVAPMLVVQTERGDEMFMTMLRRHCQHVLDTEALEILPEPVVAEPLTPDIRRMNKLTPPAMSRCGAARAGTSTSPTRSRASAVGAARPDAQREHDVDQRSAVAPAPDMPTIALVDFHDTGAIELTLDAAEPLRTYTVTVRGNGRAYDDPAALLHGQPGRSVEASMELIWTTAGTPYQYRITPRYEIPCSVSGSVTVDGREYTLNGVPGQRDHSWGVRDWWSMDWVWSALHFDDGTHVHGVDIRIPGAPPIGIGYAQRPGEALVELQAVAARETFADNGLPASTEITFNPGELVVTIDIQGHAPVLLTSPDGRISHFPRAWATVTTADGRTGVGWVE